jgi:Zn-dependent M28 family amino/carboxypeptidase
VSVLLGLIDRLQGMEWNYSVDFVFFDQEESGMWGSAMYVQQFLIPSRYLGMINVDVVGAGEEVYIGPVGPLNYNLLPYLKAAAKMANVPFVAKAEYPPSDYLTFAAMKLETISVSVVPRGDGEKMSASIKATGRADSASAPRVIGIMHTPDDRAILIKPESLKLAYDFLRATMEAINERQ